MASLRDIRKRIRSVRSTQKITRAMKLVSAAKLKRAQSAIVSARPYALGLQQVVLRIAEKQKGGHLSERLLQPRETLQRIMVVTLTSDRGMCGAFNSNVIRRTERFLKEQTATGAAVELGAVGRRGRDYFAQRGVVIRHDYSDVLTQLKFTTAQSIARQITTEFIDEQIDAVFFVYNRFQSAMTQVVTIEPVLPIITQELQSEIAHSAAHSEEDYIYEPGRDALLKDLLPKYLATQIWRMLLESVASEHGARMTAMESATKNATEMIDRLTLSYNRARQAGITKELIEIVSGAEAQKG